jgi:hypothetical protein
LAFLLAEILKLGRSRGAAKAPGRVRRAN